MPQLSGPPVQKATPNTTTATNADAAADVKTTTQRQSQRPEDSSQNKAAPPHQPKFSIVEILILIPIAFILDFLSIVLAIVGFGIAPYIIDGLYFPISQIYLRLKGAKGMVTLIGNLINLIPFLGDFSCSRTLSIGLALYADHYPDSYFGKLLKVAAEKIPVGGGSGAKVKTPKIA